MSQVNNRMVVNAALEKLTERAFPLEEHARVVIQYGSKLRREKMVSIEYIHSQSSEDNISGCTPDQGEVTIKDSQHQQGEEKTFGVYKDRIGHFRLWKSREGLLVFHHFWKSSPTTMSADDSEPDEYCLGYNPKTLDFEYFGMLGQKEVVFQIWFVCWFVFSVQHIELISGNIRFKSKVSLELTGRL